MDKEYIEELFLSVRPYLSEAGSIMTFLETHAASEPDELTAAIEDAVHTYSGTKKTDFSILLNAHLKMMGTK